VDSATAFNERLMARMSRRDDARRYLQEDVE
jgi:hypothetical protein